MSRHDRVWACFWAAWILAVVAVQFWAWRHDGAAGAGGVAAGRWPAGTRLTRDPGRATLVMFVAEGCPCSLASLRELERLLAGLPEGRAPRAWVVFVGEGPAGRLGDLAGGIPGVEIWRDGAGTEAARFGARTSGQVVSYSLLGTLVFEGGLTMARGHEGKSAGRAALEGWLDGRPDPGGPIRVPTFGCDLMVDAQGAGGG